MVLPIRSKNPPESLPFATCMLIAINTAVFFLTSNGLSIHKAVLEQYGFKASHVTPITLLSSIFLHANLFHLIGNMWFLYIFGFAVEGRLRSLKFVGLYLASGICGAFLHLAVIGRFYPDLPAAGASGAIMGVIGAALYMFPFAPVQLLWLWWLECLDSFPFGLLQLLSFFSFESGSSLFDCPMWGVAAIYGGLDVLEAILDHGSPDCGVGHFAHLGGMAAGIVLCLLLRPTRDRKEVSDAKATHSVSGDLECLSHHELALLYEADPNNLTVLLNWMRESLDVKKVSDPCSLAFVARFDRLVAKQPPLTVAECASRLSQLGVMLDPAALVKLASKLEHGGSPSMALTIYYLALGDARITPADEECALFRSAIIYETRLKNKPTAIAWYKEFLNRFPIGPLTDQARSRLSSLQTT